MYQAALMYCFGFSPASFFLKVFLDQGFWFPTPLKHSIYLAVKHAPLLTCLPAGGGWGGAGGSLIPGPTEGCEGSIKIIKVSFPSCSWADFRKLSREKNCHDRPNGLFLFAKILLLSGAPGSQSFLQMHQDTRLLSLHSWWFFSFF